MLLLRKIIFKWFNLVLLIFHSWCFATFWFLKNESGALNVCEAKWRDIKKEKGGSLNDKRKLYPLLSSKTCVPFSAWRKQSYLYFPNLKKKTRVGFLIHVFYKTVSQFMCWVIQMQSPDHFFFHPYQLLTSCGWEPNQFKPGAPLT